MILGHKTKFYAAAGSLLFTSPVVAEQQATYDAAIAPSIGQTKISEKVPVEFRADVRLALEIVPEAKPYVDPQNGNFDYRAARLNLGLVEARKLRAKWDYALSDVRANA